jgi:hypothetical protein
VTTPGLTEVMTGAWLASTVISPSTPGMITDSTFAETSSRSGETSSNWNGSAIC